jgi:hypothetical protein
MTLGEVHAVRGVVVPVRSRGPSFTRSAPALPGERFFKILDLVLWISDGLPVALCWGWAAHCTAQLAEADPEWRYVGVHDARVYSYRATGAPAR